MELLRDMDELLPYGVEGLSRALDDNLYTWIAFVEIVDVIGEILTLITEESEGRINTRESFN